jgi:membrane-associated phospholipid phosphatase
MGIKGKSNFKDRTLILATSYLLVAATTLPLKNITHVQRPDGSSANSFPSGHTATAFAGAEFLWQEYKDVSIWYGISGYVVATGTGFFRMYNDRHWLTDVAGAGIGILCTKTAYWLYQKCKNYFSKETKRQL